MARQKRCRAADPATCREHGQPHAAPESSISAFKQFMGLSSPVPLPADIVDAAVNSPLAYKGKKPQWWKKYEQEAQKNPQLATRPELIDVIDSPVGSLAVVWEDQSQMSNDTFVLRVGSGMNSCTYRSMETGEILGYIKMNYVDDATFKRSYGDDEFTAFRWREQNGGSLYGLKYGADGERGVLKEGTTKEDVVALRRQVWLRARKDLGGGMIIRDDQGNPVPNNQLENHMPDDDAIASDVKSFAARLNTTIAEYKRVGAVPFVDFSRVEESLAGRGMGSALYVYTARMLGKQGKLLRASQQQKPEAKAVWDRFEKKFPERMGTLQFDDYGKTQAPRTLDFRA